MARQMKDSGMEWIGEIPDTWSLSRVGSYISIVESGVSVNAGINPAGEGELGVLKTSCVSTGKFNPVENKAVNKDEAGRVGCPVRAGCLIVSRMNTPELVGACGYVEQSYPNIYLPDRLWQIHVNPGYSAKFAYYYLTSSLARSFYASIAVGTSSSMQNISQKEFSSMRCTCPPYVEQERIAIFLDAKCAEIDKVVEQTRATIEEYKKLKQAIITEAVTKGVRGPRPMKSSGVEWIGDIPEEWSCSRVGRHYYITLGKMLCTAPADDSYSYEPYYCAADVHFEGVSPIARKKMWFSQGEKKDLLVKKGDLLVTEGGTGGCAIVQECVVDTYIQNSLMIVRGKANAIETYLRYWLESLIKRSYLDYLCNKVTIIHFTKEKLSKVPFPIPSLDEQKEIATYLNTKCAEIDRIIEQKEQLIEEIGSYKKSLIYEYVTGKKEVTA